MTSSATDGSEDVNDFLQRIKELGERRDSEDEERTRKLEEEILQGRKERQARRAERARSISPTKSSPVNTPNATRVTPVQASSLSESFSSRIEPKEQSTPARKLGQQDAMERLIGMNKFPTKENFTPGGKESSFTESGSRAEMSKTTPSHAIPQRTPTLSWQQRRPNSQASDHTRSRPLSMVAAENAARSPRNTPAPEEPTPSREQIAASLSSKSPDWFKQTADRGVNSPAYRKNQVEDEDRADHGSVPSRVQMPGMSRGPSASSNSMGTPDRSASPSRSSGFASGYTSSPRPLSGFGSPMPLTPAQTLDPPSETKTDVCSTSPTHGRISPERMDRPMSPTKGMGGFVQSAMMKRSDSVNKRWSVQSPPGLQRADSVAGNRPNNDLGDSLGSAAGKEIKPSGLGREASPRPNSRPTSSHSNVTLTQERSDTASSMRSSVTNSTTSESVAKPALSSSRAETPTGVRTERPAESSKDNVRTPPTSPSKTMDSRRWSPTKSSWLETALNKPESPRPAPKPAPSQPAWMTEIAKAKAKGSVDNGRSTSPHKHQVSIGGLLRSPPMGGSAQPHSIGGLPAGFSSGAVSKNRSDSIVSQERKGSLASVDSPAGTPSSKSSLSVNKPKPDTPPKKDFRANLKSRQPPTESPGTNEPEFKNVFGTLRRTKTQNYVAPDDLKDNITRGKAALNLTGGPKKTERKDEFKEAILKKKDDFKKAQVEGKGVTRTPSGSQEVPVPEALAKRRALGRSDSITADGDLVAKRTTTDGPKPIPVTETSAIGRLQNKDVIGSKLAARFNPALAGMLARGPPSMASDTSRSSSPALSQRTVSKTDSAADSTDAGPHLTHMTKGRARGPRRKAPTAVATPAAPEETQVIEPPAPVRAPSPQKLSEVKSVFTAKSSEPASKEDVENPVSQPSSPRKLDLKRRSQFLQEAPNTNSKTAPLDAPRPLSPTKTADGFNTPVKAQITQSEVEAPKSTKSVVTTPAKSTALSSKPSSPVTAKAESPQTSRFRPQPLSPTKPQVAEPLLKHVPSPVKSQSPVSVRGAAAQWAHNDSSAIPPPVKSPIKLPTLADEKAAMVGAGLKSASPVKEKPSAGLGIQTSRIAGARPLPTPPNKGPLSPPNSAEFRSPPLSATFSETSSDASKMLTEFFGTHKSTTQFKFDTTTLLATRPDHDKNIKTLRAALYQISSDGKIHQVPSHQERILFEGNQYLCTHTFGDPSGKRVSEVYIWIGDQVSDSDVDAAKPFAEREATNAGCKLIPIDQGRETPEFISALGGIMITRRGSSNKYDSLAPHILCGRKHFGQIAFDEVDFSPKSLCSGFPYLISAQSGKCYLWKGKGSGIEELSCARLIGMDFGLTGEIEEVEDGKEPVTFLSIFGTGAEIPKSADHWRMKPNYNKYCIRLFVADANAKEQIFELTPFTQTSLSPQNIYILDAFFEIYIIVGSAAHTQYDAFHNSLLFAQEFGILAAGMEDRPFVPVMTVVLEGVPRDLRGVFRKWEEGKCPTIKNGNEAGSPLKRGRSLRVLPLTVALEATRR